MRRLFAVLLLSLPAVGFADAPLIDAIKADDVPAALKLIESGADVRAKLSDGTTALHYAAHAGNQELANRLINAGALVNARNDYGSTPMQEAAERGDAALIRALLKAGADANTANDEGETALMTVARTGNVEAAKLLIKARADVNAVESWRGQTALMWAAAQSNPDMVQLLLKSGAKPNVISSVRDWARKVTAEPRPQNRPPGGFTALLLAAREGCAACAQALIKGHADLNLTNPENITPLLEAILNARFDTAKVLIEAGADVNRWDVWGRAPLYSAIDYNTTPRGGRPDRPSSDATLPLDIAKMLLDRGANPNMQLKLFPPYRSLGQDRGGDALLTTGTTPLLRAAKAGDVEATKLLLQYKALPDLQNNLGATPLLAAAGVNWSLTDIRGRFHNEQQCIETAKLLIAAGANVNAVNERGQTALHAATQQGWTQFVRFLASSGARLDVKDRGGATALDIAIGRAGGASRPGVSGPEAHPETAVALRELMAAAGAGAAR
ncbi:MAG TPA: ankyrin repeat domain-containing protein [Steroidobacteraceae bacterium]|nr:ankyrin repeat domain-containing protein [Steroidobacteraceae bacterium]